MNVTNLSQESTASRPNNKRIFYGFNNFYLGHLQLDFANFIDKTNNFNEMHLEIFFLYSDFFFFFAFNLQMA